MAAMFSESIFAIEVDGVPRVAFECRKHSDADQLCQHWAARHLRPRHANMLPPVVKFRLARPDERALYERACINDHTGRIAFVSLMAEPDLPE